MYGTRSLINRLRDNIEELRHSLQPKENAIEALQQSLVEKDQVLNYALLRLSDILNAVKEKW